MTKNPTTPPAPAPKSEWDTLDVPVEHRGRAISLPAEPGKMPLAKAIEALQRKQADEEQTFDVHEEIQGYPTDAAVACTKAMIKLYGWASPQTEEIFFFGMPIEKRPTMLAVKTGPGIDDVMQCPLGMFRLPGVDVPVKTLIYEGLFMVCAGKVKKRDRHVVLELANETRRIVREESIYRGRPIRIGVNEDGDLDLSNPPIFLDVSDISEADVLFDEQIQAQIDTSILVPVKHTAVCREHRIPLKRGILLSGSYGTGKSLLARLTARVAEQHQWTFVLLDNVRGLRAALEFANRYAPAVVFAEDIDRVAEERDERTNDLINVIDGVVSKSSEIMVILTTNFVEKLDPVILRPGRLDAVISLKAPNAGTVERLVRYYAGPLLAEGENLADVGRELDGQIPASIRECVERAKLGMIGRADSKLSAGDLLTSAQTMKNHLALLNKKASEVTSAERLATSLRDVMTNGGDERLMQIHKKVTEIHNSVT